MANYLTIVLMHETYVLQVLKNIGYENYSCRS